MHYLSASVYAVLAASLAALGCSAPVSEAVDRDAAEGAASAAVVVVERTVSADESVHASIVARFLRMKAGSVDDDALRMVGATLNLPAVDTCAPASAGSATSVQAEPRAVELLDVGTLAIESGGIRTALEARSLPDIVDLVSGVVYSTRSVSAATSGAGLPSRGVYRLSSGGSAEGNLPSFAISATAPGEPAALRVRANDAREGDQGDGLVIASGGSRVDLAWDLADTSVPGDLVYVDVSGVFAPGTAVPTVRCLFADRGSASVPASAFGESREGGTLTIHRVHREAFHVGGIDSGVLRFDFARAVPFTRR